VDDPTFSAKNGPQTHPNVPKEPEPNSLGPLPISLGQVLQQFWAEDECVNHKVDGTCLWGVTDLE
jgi:hypothetical protein